MMTIDYEKLKLAHELLVKLIKKEGTRIDLIFSYFSDGDVLCSLINYDSDSINTFRNVTINFLIYKLQELIQPKPKYEIGQEVWVLDANEPIQAMIKDMTGDPIKLWFDNGCFYEEACYPTREAIIDAQIEYWSSLKNEDMPMSPPFEGEVQGFRIGKQKCKKCGEFY